ncbi:hypothetical protein C8F04DRAFT_1068752 [Mycena alexandri]|uniref:Uncharacterized protein n=1 Tax=Mycena alexandri TaxID=1745969 RepID=A0AAD6TDN2_9AGAR|nr:hypothetical protein C8F04DRAFT_1068752 [Mycena alexandri]
MLLFRQLLAIGLFTLVVASQEEGIAQSSVDVLNNKYGLSPCEMQETFKQTCQTSQAAEARDNDNDNTTVTPTACTCTNVYFNLWSACIFSMNSTLPLSESLTQKCNQASINIITNKTQEDTIYPGWAFMELPPSSNGTFDPIAAVETAKLQTRSEKWDAVQIVVPILVGVGVAAILLVSFFFCRRRKRTNQRQRPWMKTAGSRPRFQFPTLSSATKVRELDRSTSWSIDEQQEALSEYQFVSYPASLQGSHVSGHVRLSSSSSGHPPGPPPLKIPTGQKESAWVWPGKTLWGGPLQSAMRLSESMPRPWRSTKRVAVKNIPGYNKFRVDASDSDSPLSQRPHAESLLGHTGRSRTNLHHSTIFEGENEEEEDSDSDTEALPLISQDHSRSNHDAEPPAVNIPPSVETETESPGSSQRAARQIPASCAPPSVPLPVPPPPPKSPRTQPAAASSSQSLPRTNDSHPTPPPVVRTQRNFPPAPTAPPPSPPTVTKRSPRPPRSPLPTQITNAPAFPSPPLPSPSLSGGQLAPPPPNDIHPPLRRRPDSDGGSSVRSLPFAPTSPYIRGAPAPIQVPAGTPSGNTPPNSAPPYVRRPSLDNSHSPAMPPKSPPLAADGTRSVRRLPLPPG